MTGAGGEGTTKAVPLRVALVVTVVAAVALGSAASQFYYRLAAISPCCGGLAPGGPECSGPVFLVEQQGHSQSVEGTYWCTFLIYSDSGSEVLASPLIVSVWNDSGTIVPLLSVPLFAGGGSILANHGSVGTNWTSDSSVEVLEPDLLNATSAAVLRGQYISITDSTSGTVADSPID